jgi:hypothetical protein
VKLRRKGNMNDSYHFVSCWRFEAKIEEVADILSDGPGFSRWWPSVYLKVLEVEPGDEQKVGTVVDLYTKGWLPYTLRWQGRVTRANYPYGFSLETTGDFIGRGVWTLKQSGAYTEVEYEWWVQAAKPLLRYLSPLLKPVFSANHRWAMARGEESMRLELARRRAATPEERAAVPPAPPPTWRWGTKQG